MKNYFKLSIVAIALIALSACNKTKSTSNKLIKAGEWQIIEMSVDGVNEDELPIWEIEDCSIYEESCFAEWINEEGGHAEFVWQFREKADVFEISYQAEDEEGHAHEEDHAAEEAAEQAYNFSGVYEVVEKGKNKMEFTSVNSIGFPGQSVKIIIEKI